jgi:hypothetical protein
MKFDSGKYMEFDAWIPKHNVCFEYQVGVICLFNYLNTNLLQDEYHYVTTWYSELTREKIKQKDNILFIINLFIYIV